MTGTYQVFRGDKLVQTDRYEYTHGQKVVDEITTTDGKGTERWELSYNGNALPRLTVTSNGLTKISAAAEGDVLTFREGEAMVGALPLQPDLILVEPTAFAELAVLLDAYDATKGGRQQFQIVIPTLQDYFNADVERHGWDNVVLAGKSTDLAHTRIAIGKKETVNLWADHDRIVGMYFASKGLTVADAAFPGLQEQLKKLVNKAL
jgi:hypothetical protein